jgi:sugar phosphate isomerase/epimerase
MLLGMDTASYLLATGLGDWRPSQNPPMRLEHFLRKAAELSLSSLLISDLRLLERADYGYLSGLRREAEQDGLVLLPSYTGFRGDHLQDTLRVAGALGAEVVVFYPEFNRPAEEETLQVRLEGLQEILTQALPVAEKYTVKIAIGGGGRLCAQELLDLHQGLANQLLGFCIDPLSALLVLEDPLEWAEDLGAQVLCLRLTDYQLVANAQGAQLFSCVFGEGVLDLANLTQRVRENAPEARINISTAGEAILLGLLEEKFLERIHYATPVQLARLLRLVRDRGLAEAPVLPQHSDLPEDEVLAEEDERFEQSLEWLRVRMTE